MEARRDSANLDFVRSVAVLFVLGFHLYLFFQQNHSIQRDGVGSIHLWPIGHWGVLIFFVDTSLVWMFSLEREQICFRGQSLHPPFLTRRIFRIFPLSIFMVLLAASFSLPGHLQAGEFVPVHLRLVGILSNLLLLQNVSYQGLIIAHLLSPPFEMRMYLFLPALFLLALFVRGVLLLLGVWGIAVFLDMILYRLDVPATAYTGLRPGFPDLLIYVPCFLSGIVSYKLAKGRTLKLPAAIWPIVLTALTVAYLTQPSFKVGWICCLLSGVAASQFREMTNSAVKKIFQTISRYSYGIYLTHFLCTWLAFQALHSLPIGGRWMVLAVTLVLAPYILYHGLEEPMIRVGGNIAVKFGARRAAKRHVWSGHASKV